MRISEYPYGRITKKLKWTANHLNRNYKSIIKKFLSDKNDLSLDDISYLFHDDPGMSEFKLPRKIYNSLNTDEVDWLQEGWYDLVERYIKKYEI